MSQHLSVMVEEGGVDDSGPSVTLIKLTMTESGEDAGGVPGAISLSLGSVVEVGRGSDADCGTGGSDNSDDGVGDETDSDCSGASGAVDGRGVKHGSYSFVEDERYDSAGHLARDECGLHGDGDDLGPRDCVAEDDDGVSVELEDGDSNFNTDEECSSIDVTDSDCSSNQDDVIGQYVLNDPPNEGAQPQKAETDKTTTVLLDESCQQATTELSSGDVTNTEISAACDTNGAPIPRNSPPQSTPVTRSSTFTLLTQPLLSRLKSYGKDTSSEPNLSRLRGRSPNTEQPYTLKRPLIVSARSHSFTSQQKPSRVAGASQVTETAGRRSDDGFIRFVGDVFKKSPLDTKRQRCIPGEVKDADGRSMGYSPSYFSSESTDGGSDSDTRHRSVILTSPVTDVIPEEPVIDYSVCPDVDKQVNSTEVDTVHQCSLQHEHLSDPNARSSTFNPPTQSGEREMTSDLDRTDHPSLIDDGPPEMHDTDDASASENVTCLREAETSPEVELTNGSSGVLLASADDHTALGVDHRAFNSLDYVGVSSVDVDKCHVRDTQQNGANFVDGSDDSDSDNLSNMLSRKPAVRRKGYAWVSKSLPRKSEGDIRNFIRAKGRNYLQTGSSLDLAPSLLNIYDDKAAAGVRLQDNDDSEEDEESHEQFLQKVNKTQSLPAKTNGRWGGAARPGILPSLSEPGDRPVSLVVSDWSPSAQHADSKKRPLSLSSMSSASSSSLPRLRKKRANGGPSPRPGRDAVDGSQISEHSHADSRISVDSGCMDGDKHGDDVSLISSDQASWRDDLDSSSTSIHSASPEAPSAATSPPEKTPNNRSTRSQSPSTISSNSGNSRTWTPRSKRTESTPGSQKSNKSSASFNDKSDFSSAPGSPSSYVGTPTSSGSTPSMTPDSSHRQNRSSRHEARKRFFLNYEEHMKSASGLDLSPQGSHEHLSYTLSSTAATSPLVHDRTLTSTQSLPAAAQSEIFREERLNPPQHARRLESHGDRESPSHAPRRTDGRSSRKEKLGSPNALGQKSASGKSTKRKDAGSNRDSTEAAGVGGYVSYVQRVVTEIIESERTYICSLKDIIQGYLEPFEEILNSTEEVKDIECLFGNIREIYKFGCAFLTDLEATGADPVKVAECFVKHNQGFVIYADYCTNYPRAVDILTKFMKHPERSELCKERQLSLGHGLPLGAYLLRPVQRILKYHLLLQNIVKNYEKEGKELEILQKAFHHMTEMAHHINEMKRRHEHAVRIQEIQSQLEDYVGEDLTRLGELVLESTFRVYGAKASRQVFLFERGLLISKKTDGGMLSCKTFILCSNLMLVEVIPNEPLSFHIIPFDNPRAQYTLQARNMEQKRKWCQEIKRLILESFKGKIPDSVKSLVMQLGSNHDDDYITKEALEAVRKTQHTAPEYLEKRRFRRKSGSRLPDFSLLKPQKAKKGVNKKTETKTTEMARRAESKSPDARRRLIPQNAIKRRSHSHSVLMLSPSTSEPVNASVDNSTSTPASPSTDLTGPLDEPQALSVPKEESPNKSKRNAQKQTELEKEAELIKRAQSFRNAMRSHPITSADLTEIVTRCGGSVRLAEPDNLTVENGSGTSFIDSPETSLLGLRSIDSSSDEDLVDSDLQNMAMKETEGSCETKAISDSVVNSEVTQQPLVLNTNSTHSASVQVLNSEIADTNGIDEEAVLRNDKNSRISSQNIDNLNGQKGKSRLSRRDQPMVKKRHKENEINEDGSAPRRVTAFHDSYSKRVAEKAILRNKGLRLPNTSKHLSVPGSETQNSAKLTDWNSVEKLTAGSLNDLSHLKEDPWVMNTEMTSSESSMDMTGANRSNSFSNNISTPSPIPTVGSTTRPRGHSDLTEMMQVATNRGNLDWMVYLNRNSLSAKSDINNSCSSVLEKDMKSRDSLSHQNSAMHHLPYATPPRSFMTSENMKKHNYLENSSRNSYQKKSGVNAFGGMPQTVTLTKPTVFHVPSLTRSNSTPLATTRTGKPVQDRRPSSMDVDRLTDESNRMVAEMEEYISNSVEEIKTSTNKFPTSLPTITVEEDANNNRLSVVSSASSYESQDSSSSDGLVGTLKHKLHVWANHSGGRRDSEQSHSSTLTSEEDEEEDTDEAMPSGNTYDPPSNNRILWRESRDLENVLREHSLGSSSLGSRMAHALSLPQKMTESELTVTSPDNYAYSIVEIQPPISSTPEDASIKTCSSLTPTKAATESLCKDHDIPPLSTVTSQSNDSSVSTTVPPSDHIPEPIMDVSEDSSKEATPKTKPKFNTMQSNEEYSNLRRESSMESVCSIDSFYERRFSSAIDSEVFLDKPSAIKQTFDESQASLPRKSIREYVQHIEQKFKPQSPKILEVKRKEPGAMIRQRLETLRENIIHGRHRSFSRQSSEERESSSRAKSQPPSQHRNKLPTAFKTENRWNDDFRMYDIKTSNSRDSLTKSLENLSRSKDNLTRSRDILTFDFESLSTPGHEKDASRFIYMNLDHSGNQFIHRTPSTSDQKELDSNSLSQSMCRLDQLSTDLDNLVIMKGWVKALISKFQEKESN